MVIDGEWFFGCCQLFTAKIGRQRKEDGDFLTDNEITAAAWMELLSTMQQSTSKLSNFIKI